MNQCALEGRQTQLHVLPVVNQCAIEVRQFHVYVKLSVNQSVTEGRNFQVHLHQGDHAEALFRRWVGRARHGVLLQYWVHVQWVSRMQIWAR